VDVSDFSSFVTYFTTYANTFTSSVTNFKSQFAPERRRRRGLMMQRFGSLRRKEMLTVTSSPSFLGNSTLNDVRDAIGAGIPNRHSPPFFKQ